MRARSMASPLHGPAHTPISGGSEERMSLRPFFVLVLALAGCLGEVSDGSGIDEISGEIVSSAPSFTGSIAPAAPNNPYGFNDDWGIRPEASMNLRAYDTARRANF